MGAAYKNFWSLNVDEAIVSGILRSKISKTSEVFMPMNAQCKDIDLVIMDMPTKNILTAQVKGSRAFEPDTRDLQEYGFGNKGWCHIGQSTLVNATSDYFIFLIYVIDEDAKIGRRSIKPHSIVIPTDKLKELSKSYKKIVKNGYDYYFWINPKTNEAFDIRDNKYFVSEYLDDLGYQKLINRLDGQKVSSIYNN